jgi:uncharacterized protein YggE
MKSSNLRGVFIFALSFALPLFDLKFATADEAPPKEATVKVQGEGKVSAVPDQAQLEFEVREDGAHLEDVSAQVRDKMKKVFQTVKAFGIVDKDFQTVSYNIEPKYRYDKNGGESQRIGYTVSNRIRVVLKDVDSAGKVLDAVTQAEVSEVEGPTFGFSDPAKLQIEALKAAIEDAHAKALALAQSAEAQLGKVFSIVQMGTEIPGPRPMMFKMAASAAAEDVPIAKGQDEVTAQVEVVYSLK